MSYKSGRWVYGVTTVAQRFDTLLPRTLNSLAQGGFDRPHIFVDGHGLSPVKHYYTELVQRYEGTYPDLPLTVRSPAVKCHAHWTLALLQLFLTDPTADYYALFQDDFVCYRNLREYLTRNPCPDKGYMNLYTATATNEPIISGKPYGTWHEGGLVNRPRPDAPVAWQAGRGAVALAFNREAAYALASSSKMVEHATDMQRGWRKVDGAIVNAMNQAGYREYVHSPSLVQHTGHPPEYSTTKSMPIPLAATFLGEEVDALSFLQRG